MKKKIITIAILVFLLMASVGALFCLKKSVPQLKKDRFVFEYGQKVKIKNEELLDTKDEAILDSIELDLSKIPLEKDKEYPSVGIYTLKVAYKTKLKTIEDEINVEVKDTIKPTFIKFEDEVKVKTGSLDVDLSSFFKVEDLSEVKVKFELDSVDFQKAGEYDAKIIAEDAYENKIEKAFVVIVEDEIKEKKSEDTKKDESKDEKPVEDKSEETPEDPSSPTYVDGILVVNKKHPFQAMYETGEDPTAGSMVRKMIADMQAQGLDVSSNYSGYRSYAYQDGLYWSYVNSNGQALADTFSARAGYSEHQTGLAFDLLHSSGILVEKSAEADWIASNAHKYGFIVRYQAGKEHITGYQAEPWHVRYVGDQAASIYQSGLTLEEYLGVEGGDYA